MTGTIFKRHIKNGTKYLFFSLLCFRMFFCSSCAYRNNWEQPSPEIISLIENSPGQEDFPDAAALILLDEGHVEFIGKERLASSIFQKRRIVKILQYRGQSYANIVIPYGQQSFIKNIRARTLSPDGTITILKKDRIFDRSLYPGFIFFSDQRAKIFTLPAVEPGSVIEYEYTLHIQSQSLWHAWYFQDDIPVFTSRFTLIAPSAHPVKWKSFGAELEPKIEKTPSEFKSTYIWEHQNIPPLLQETGKPPYRESGIWLAIYPAWVKSWDYVTGWIHALWKPQMKPGHGVKTLAKELTRDIKTESGKLKNIFTWVRDHIRYISIQIGNGGYQPHHVDDILTNRYGDCKDMTALVCALAREAGIKTYPLLISTKQNGYPDTTLISHNHFNHVIAYSPSVAGNAIFMDCTEKGCPFGNMPWYDQGTPALMIADEGSARLIKTPINPPDENHRAGIWRIKLDTTGAALVRGQTNLKGAYGDDLREKVLNSSKRELHQWMETYLIKRSPGAKIDTFEIVGLNPVQDPLTVSYKFHNPSFSIPAGDEIIIQPEQAIAFDLTDEFTAWDRTYPIRFNYGSKDEIVIIMRLPDNWMLHTPVFSDSLVTAFGAATWELINYNTHIRYKTTIQINGEDILPDRYIEFQDFLDRVQSTYRQKRISLKKRS